MVDLYGKKWKRQDLLRYVGSVQQLGGAKPFRYSDGKADGVSGVQINTGGGLIFTVLPGRGMDISEAHFRGYPLGYFSGTGITAPGYFEESQFKWLRSFFGGLVTTCGLTNAGVPSEDEGQAFGLHGRISNAGAENICVEQGWEGDEYLITVKGTVREASNLGEHLTLTRSVQTHLGAKSFRIIDHVENHGFTTQPLMIMYHINMGFPLLSPNARFVGPILSTEAGNDPARNADDCLEIPEPQQGYQDQIFLHNMASDASGNTFMSLVNPDIGNGAPLGLVVRYNVNQLPKYTEWKMPESGGYIITMEPGTVTPAGRGVLRRQGELPMLEAQTGHTSELSFEVLHTREELEAIEKEAQRLIS